MKGARQKHNGSGLGWRAIRKLCQTEYGHLTQEEINEWVAKAKTQHEAQPALVTPKKWRKLTQAQLADIGQSFLDVAESRATPAKKCRTTPEEATVKNIILKTARGVESRRSAKALTKAAHLSRRQ